MTYKRMLVKLKDKLYNAFTQPGLTLGLETYALVKKKEKILGLTEMRMLQRIRGVTLKARRRNKEIRKELMVANILEKVRDMRSRWFGEGS